MGKGLRIRKGVRSKDLIIKVRAISYVKDRGKGLMLKIMIRTL